MANHTDNPGYPESVVNATEPLVVVVGARDIRGAKAKDPENCAFARACRREHPELVKARFYKTTAFLDYPDRTVRYMLPPSMQKEIVAIDRGGKFAPGTYQLSRVPPSFGRKPVGKVRGSQGGAGANRAHHITVEVRGADD
jgi:hypothetical protein